MKGIPAGRTIRSLLAGVVLLLLAPAAVALEIPERPEARIMDRAGVLTARQAVGLERTLADFERRTTNQIAVLIIPSLEGESLEDFSIRLAEKWKIGQKGKNNGVILLIARNDRKLRIEVGYGLEGVLPDALAGSIIRQEIALRFRDGRYFEGIEAGLRAIMAATQGEYKAPQRRGGTLHLPSWAVFLILVFIFGTVGLMAFASRRRYYSAGSGGWHAGGGWGGGDWGGGGGFSGGGGDFGGGGASGNW